MNLRRITSLTAMLSGSVLLLTSIILYIVPAGRVAYWANWTLWGMTKQDWGAVHINMGVLFMLALALHVYFNISSILAYLKNKARKITVLTPDFNAALAVTLIFCAGTLVGVPPFSSIINLSESIKDEAAVFYGEPPYGHAELSSLETFAKRVGLELDPTLEHMRAQSITVDGPKQTVLQIAMANNLSPQQLYQRMKPGSAATDTPKELPLAVPPGTGRRTLADLCHEYNLPIKSILRHLKDTGINADPAQTIKEIGTANSISGPDIFEAVRQASLQK